MSEGATPEQDRHAELFLGELRTYAQGDEPHGDQDKRTIDAAFERYEAGEGGDAGRRRWRPIAVAGGLAAAAAIALTLLTPAERAQPQRFAIARTSAPPPAVQPQAPTHESAALATVRSGAVRVDGESQVLGLQARVPDGVAFVAHGADTCLELAAGSVCFDPDARFELDRHDADYAGLWLHRGRAIATADEHESRPVRIRTEQGLVETSSGRVSVDVATDKPTVVIAVLVGEATHVDALGHRKGLAAGASVELGAADKVGSDPDARPLASAAELMERAQAQRAAGKLARAAATFGKLARAYPKTPEGRRAMVSVGELELTRRGRPAVALRWLDRYLKTGTGVLAQEAGYLRIRALRDLGRTKDERRAIEGFLRRYPNGSYTQRLQKRLQALAN